MLDGLGAGAARPSPARGSCSCGPKAAPPTFRKNVLAAVRSAAASRPSGSSSRPSAARTCRTTTRSTSRLDTFPLTGGTTTTESLWMGVPVVSLIGEAFFERLSDSILANCGLGDLATRDRDEYRARWPWRWPPTDRGAQTCAQTLRDRIKAGPLGQTEQFATRLLRPGRTHRAAPAKARAGNTPPAGRRDAAEGRGRRRRRRRRSCPTARSC